MSTLTYNWTFYVDFCIKPFLPFLSFCPFSFGYCIVWFFPICGLWLLLPLVSSNFSYNCLVDISILNELPNFLTLFSRYLHTEWVTKLLLQLSSRHLHTEWVTKLFLQLSSDISILNELPTFSYNCLVDISILNEVPNFSYNCLIDISILNEVPRFSYNCLVDISILNELPNFSYNCLVTSP